MITLLLGHRGVGKTSFLKGLSLNASDLDSEIERREGKSMAELLAEGEAHFRSVERGTLEKLIVDHLNNEVAAVVAVGAGFEGPIPKGVRAVWLRRAGDRQGRVFLDRPRLDAHLSPLDEYLSRFETRESRYSNWALGDQLFLPEGYESGLEFFVTGGSPPAAARLNADFTLLPEHFRQWPKFWEQRKEWGWRLVELREDVLSENQIAQALATVPREQILFSIRRPRAHQDSRTPTGARWDWPLELGTPPLDIPLDVVSLHNCPQNGDLESLSKWADRARVLKLAIEVNSFGELERGHRWWQEDPCKRAFLPRSRDGRWRWYRSLFGPKMPLHFIREGDGSSLDQPYLYQSYLQEPYTDKFAAVLGDPVDHSRSPMEHREFFKGTPFVGICVQIHEWHEAIGVLQRMGLVAAAVTSPLKQLAYKTCIETTARARELASVNTICFHDNKWHGENTDVLALKQLQVQGQNVWLWGGGGVVTSIRQVWPHAKPISARLGLLQPEADPDLLIWAVGRNHNFQWPPPPQKPYRVLDLNYTADSPGLEWAVKHNLPYQSGLRMFKLQAAAQREYWRSKGV